VRSAGEEEPADNPFRTFDEWYSDADADAYADLTELVPNRGGLRVRSFVPLMSMYAHSQVSASSERFCVQRWARAMSVSRRWWVQALELVVLIALLGALPADAADGPHAAVDNVEVLAERLGRDLEAAVKKMQPLVERYGYAGVAGAVALEGFGIPAPGQSLLMAGALEAARGHMQLMLLLPIAVLAAVLGNSLGYLIGRRGGRPLLRRLGVNAMREAKLSGLFERYGGGFILLARFVDGPRQLNGILAGTLAMPWWLFTVFNVAGAVLWIGLWGLGAFYLSEHLHAIHHVLRRVNPWVAGVVLVAVVAAIVYLFRGRARPPRRP
jgi:membrane protein DedA with SNARE-associated domain